MILTAQPASCRGLATSKAEYVNGQSVITRCRSHEPQRVLTPRHRGPAAWSFLSGFGGGLVNQDHLNLEVVVEPEAKLFVGTQASTKVYRRAIAGQHVVAQIANDAVLAFVPDHLSVYRDASLTSTNDFELEATANLFAVDWMSSGRLEAHDPEHWQAQRIAVHTTIKRDSRLLIDDRLELSNERDPTAIADHLGPCECLLTCG